jgi:hypothetical protein
MPLEPAREVANAADVRVALGTGETGLREDLPNRVAVEILYFIAAVPQLLHHPLRDCALPRPGKAGEP